MAKTKTLAGTRAAAERARKVTVIKNAVNALVRSWGAEIDRIDAAVVLARIEERYILTPRANQSMSDRHLGTTRPPE